MMKKRKANSGRVKRVLVENENRRDEV